MKKFISVPLTAAMMLFALSCTKDGAKEGKITFRINDLSGISIEDVTKSQVSDYATLPAEGDFKLEITDADKASVWAGKLSDYPADLSLTQGSYTATAIYGTEGAEGKNKPYFKGSRNFAVEGGGNAIVSVDVKLANTVVKILCTPQFKSYYTDCTFTINTGSGSSFTLADGEAAFIEAYRFSVKGSMKNPQGASVNFEKEFTSGIDAAKCYTVKLDASNIGAGSISISFNNDVTEVDLGELEINE